MQRGRRGSDPREVSNNNTRRGAFRRVNDNRRGGVGPNTASSRLSGPTPGTGTAFVPGNPAAPVAASGTPAVIHQLLTSPRSGGLAGTSTAQGRPVGVPTFLRGIAGVASKSEAVGIKVYKGKELHSEWEFVYDYRKDQSLRGQAGPTQSTEAPMRNVQGRRTIDRSRSGRMAR